MLQGSAIWWFAFDVAREFDLGGGKASFERDLGAFVLGSNGGNVDVGAQCFAATFVDDADRCADFSIGKCGNVLLEKVDEATFALEQGEELKGCRGIGFFGFVRYGWFGDLDRLGSWRDGKRVADVEGASGEKSVEENAEKTGPSEPKPGGERKRGEVGHAR